MQRDASKHKYKHLIQPQKVANNVPNEIKQRELSQVRNQQHQQRNKL